MTVKKGAPGAGSGFDAPKKKLLSVTGRFKPPPPPTGDEGLKQVVSSQRAAVARAGKPKTLKAVAKTLDPAVLDAAQTIKRFAARPDKLALITELLAPLAPEQHAAVFAQLPRRLRDEIDGILAVARKQPAWAKTIR